MKLVCRTIYIHYIKVKCLRIAAISDSIESIPSGDRNATIKIHTNSRQSYHHDTGVSCAFSLLQGDNMLLSFT